MSSYVNVLTKSYKPRLQSLRDDLKARQNKDFFWPTGTQVYVGRQGSGKTISAVKHLHDLKERYPKAIIVTNVGLNTLKGRPFQTKNQLRELLSHLNKETEYIYFKTMEQLELVLTQVNNGIFGVIYLIDEIHTYFNALESKNIPMYVFTEISQQRKQRKLIIGTSQLFLRMAKPLREQCDNLIVCNTLLGFWTFQRAYDGMTLEQDYNGNLQGKKKKSGWFFHTRRIRKSFNTFQKVVSGAEQYEQMQRIEVTAKGKKIGIK